MICTLYLYLMVQGIQGILCTYLSQDDALHLYSS